MGKVYADISGTGISVAKGSGVDAGPCASNARSADKELNIIIKTRPIIKTPEHITKNLGFT